MSKIAICPILFDFNLSMGSLTAHSISRLIEFDSPTRQLQTIRWTSSQIQVSIWNMLRKPGYELILSSNLNLLFFKVNRRLVAVTE